MREYISGPTKQEEKPEPQPELTPEDETLRCIRSVALSLDSIRRGVWVIAVCLILPIVAGIIWGIVIASQSH